LKEILQELKSLKLWIKQEANIREREKLNIMLNLLF